MNQFLSSHLRLYYIYCQVLVDKSIQFKTIQLSFILSKSLVLFIVDKQSRILESISSLSMVKRTALELSRLEYSGHVYDHN